ncbi:hypothetical protein, variant [Puccinia triticina 1-1 BBBD Race 1]|uniref:Uncharacterized protein n=1 Tax=Puccinia triticina (isolate 1-1 / race 1 (BBBD)) TaxID=630390 RepID=A0A180GCP6_PUCT1|nr:hypothetical protein, variant [Puccinia triticina 1-1 BBBD Race 1]
MSPLPSTAESWDSDPDLVLPDGPLTLLQSDTEAEAETSSSSVSALFSTNGNHSVYSVDEPHPSDDYKQRRSSQSSQDEESAQASRRDKQPSRANRTSLQTDEDDLDDDRKGGTLTLKSAHAPSNRNLHPADNFTSLSSQQPTQEHDRSFSSASSSECQSTIKASFLPLPNPDSQSSSNPIHHYRPQKTHSKRSTTQIDRTVLAVLASGAKGTVTRLEPSKRPSPVQAGLDWDEDIVLPEGGLKTVFRPTSHSTGDVKKQPSFASAISDELEDLNLGHHPSSSRSGIASSSHITRLNNQPTKSAIQCSTVNEEDGDFGDDFELPPSGQSINLTDPKKNSHRQSISKPNSAVSLTSSEFDGLDDDPFDPPKSSASSCRGSIFMTTLPNSSANSISQSNGNRGSIDDNTPRIRTRPSLTPSLMSDRSSSSFPEIEDDINEGFFDDIEFPPEFGVLNNLAPAPSSSTPTSTSGPAPPQPAPSTLPDPKGKQPVRARGLDLQTFLRSKLQARTLMAERANSSQFRENISTFEDRNDERVEDGLEIETGSIHTAKLRSRKSSSLSSASSHAHQSGHNSYFQQVHGQKSKSKRITVPFPSSNHSIASTSQPSERHARFSNNRSPLNQNHDDNTNRSTPLPSSSSAILPGRPTSHTSLITRPNSAIPPGTDTSSRVQSPLGNPSRAARLVSRVSAASSLRARVSTMAACNGPPVLSASSQRTLKHKKSAAALKSLNLGSSGPQSNSSSPSDARPPLSSPPGSNGSSNGRGLQRKQSMPSLNSRESHYTSSSGGLPPHLGGATPSGMSAASVWKSGAVPQPKARQQPYDYSSTPSSPNLIPGSALPSYADPTRASMNRHVGASAAASGSTSGLPDRSSSVNSRRSSTESVRVNACSPAPPMTVSTPAGSSRLTMPTIASRLKAKPSIIHEEHSSNSRRWTTNGMSAVIPHQLRRPRRPRTYGDGTELDEFDDLPTSKEKKNSSHGLSKILPTPLESPANSALLVRLTRTMRKKMERTIPWLAAAVKGAVVDSRLGRPRASVEELWLSMLTSRKSRPRRA